jgi:glutathione peroxidase
MNEKKIYQFLVEKLNGEEISLEAYKDKVLLIVNTASECGFTPQLKDLEELRVHFQDQNFEILAFPSNDFGQQEPLEDQDIAEFCSINYKTNFTIFNKLKVRGTYVHPLYKFLSDKKLNGKVDAAPRWNFHKYLINQNGEVVDYFYPFTKPNSTRVKKKIQKLLNTSGH